MTSEATSYNDRIVREFRAHAGHVGGEWAGTPLILVHHVGARSGTERVTPLGCFPLDGGRYAVAASSGGPRFWSLYGIGGASVPRKVLKKSPAMGAPASPGQRSLGRP